MAEPFDETWYDPALCGECKQGYDDIDKTCKAFPDGIPRAILTGRLQHEQPVEGDHDIQFARKEGK